MTYKCRVCKYDTLEKKEMEKLSTGKDEDYRESSLIQSYKLQMKMEVIALPAAQ